MTARFFDFVILRPKLALLLVALVILAAAAGSKNLWQTIDYKVYYSKTDPLRLALDDIETTFVKLNNAFVIFAPKNGNVFEAEVLRAVDEFTADAWKLPYSNRVSSITNYLHTRAVGDELQIDPILENPGSRSPEYIAQARTVLLAEKAIVGQLLSDKAHVTAVDVGLNLPDNPILEVKEVTASVRDLVAKYKEKYPDIDFYVTGSAFADQVFAEAAERDMVFLIPLSYAIIISLLILQLRSVGATVVTLLIISLSIVFAFGVKGYYDGMITPISLLTPFMIMTIAVSDCVHLFHAIFSNLRANLDKETAVRRAMVANMRPVFLTSITTAIGFFCLNFSESPALNDLGNIVGMGVSAAYFLAIVMLPAIVMLLPFRVPKHATMGSGLMGPVSEFVISNHKMLLVVMVLASMVVSIGLTKISLNEVFIDFFDETFDFKRANTFYDDNLSGFHRAEYKVDSGRENGINDPAYLHALDNFAAWLRDQREVAHVSVYTDTLKNINKSMHGDDPAHYAIPDSLEENSQYLLMYEMFLPLGFDIGDKVSQNRASTRVSVKLWLTDSETILAFNERTMDWLKQNTPSAMHAMGTGVDIMFSKTAKNNIAAMYYGTFATFVLISIILMFAFGSFSAGLVSLIPNILPAVMAFGVWGFLYGRVGLGESVVASLTLGLIVDDTIHFLNKYIEARRDKGFSAEDAVRYAFKMVGSALVVTTVVFSFGFGVLSFSNYSFNANMGALTTITICFALVMDFLLLPCLLILFDVGKTMHQDTQRKLITGGAA